MQPEGAEDCLYLNVYSRWLGPAKLPVMVYIHGGGFVYGSGTLAENGPEFLVYHDVVLVTLNYRLGAFGTQRGSLGSLHLNRCRWTLDKRGRTVLNFMAVNGIYRIGRLETRRYAHESTSRGNN